MCRSIKQLRQTPAASEADVQAAALQFVRKVSGYRAPSRANREAFDAAVSDIALITQRLLDQLAPTAVAQAAEQQPSASSAALDLLQSDTRVIGLAGPGRPAE